MSRIKQLREFMPNVFNKGKRKTAWKVYSFFTINNTIFAM